VAFDMPTLMGRDSDDDRSLGEVGHCGVAIDSALDMDTLFADIPLGDVTTSMTISGPAVPIFCMYVVAAERQGVDPGALNGTLQTDIFKEYIAQKEWLFAPEPHLRLIADLMEYCAERIPDYKPLSVSGYHIREAGSTAAQELAFTLADGFGYVELGLSRGLDVDAFAPGLSFFFDAHVDFFEEIAKFRAARRIWARWMRDTYGAKTDRAQWLRFHTQTAGVSLTGHQPYNNVVRTAVEALSAVLGGTNSLHTNALDEVLALPTEQAAEIALRTQQVLMEETGVANVADPLGGSWYVEALTDRIEAEAEAIFARIRSMGETESRWQRAYGPMTAGILRGIEDGWFMSEIAESAFWYQQQLEKGEKRVVGVNVHKDTVTGDLDIMRVSHQVEHEQRRALGERKAVRDEGAVKAALARMVEAARGSDNMIPAMLDAARAEATLGEICDALRAEWGVYSEPARF
jgi:methylmalonyl-CoA mutase N-terminal domain/subunit